MKLYYSPGACSLAAHIVLREAGVPFTLERVDLRTKVTETEADYSRINPKGYVPTLRFDDGSVLTEVAAIVQWVADQVPERHLAPSAGTMERYQLMEWLNFIASEMHKGFAPFFGGAPEATQQAALQALTRRFDHVERGLTTPFITGTHFTVVDAYLYTVLQWAPYAKLDLAQWSRIGEWLQRVAARPAVQAAHAAERGGKSA